MATTQFIESCTNATGGFEFYSATVGAVTSDTTTVRNGNLRSIRCNTSSPAAAAAVTINSKLADAGRRISFWYRFDSLPAAVVGFILILDNAGLQIFQIGLRTAGGLNNAPTGGTSVNGTATLSTNTWYRITVSYTITNTTTFTFKVYVNGVLDSTANAGTLTRTGSDRLQLKIASGAGANLSNYFSDLFVDNGTDLADTGNINVTCKLPASTNANNWNTVLGNGAVNERPISTTNGVKDSSVTPQNQNYTLQTAAVGDTDITNQVLVARTAWVWAKQETAIAGTTKITDNGTDTAITPTTSAALYTIVSTSASYPSNAAGIGMVSPGLVADPVDLYECGTIIAYQSTYTATSSLTITHATLSGTASHTTPTYTGSASPTITKASLSGSATFAPGTKTATSPLTSPVTTLSGSSTFSPGTHTTTGSLTITHASLSGVVTYSPGTHTATGSLTTGHATTSGSATFTAPVYAGTGTLTITHATTSGAGTFTSPVYTGTTALTITHATISGVDTFTAPIYNATGSLTAGHASVSGSVTFTSPVYSGVASLAVPHATTIGVATFTSPVYSGSAALTITHATISATSTFTAPVYIATGSLIVGHATSAGSTGFTAPVYIGSAALTIRHATLTGIVTFTAPVYTGSGALVTAPITSSGNGLFTAPIYTAIGVLIAGQTVITGSSQFIVPTYTGSGSFILGVTGVSGEALFYPSLAHGIATLLVSPVTLSGLVAFTPSSLIPPILDLVLYFVHSHDLGVINYDHVRSIAPNFIHSHTVIMED